MDPTTGWKCCAPAPRHCCLGTNSVEHLCSMCKALGLIPEWSRGVGMRRGEGRRGKKEERRKSNVNSKWTGNADTGNLKSWFQLGKQLIGWQTASQRALWSWGSCRAPGHMALVVWKVVCAEWRTRLSPESRQQGKPRYIPTYARILTIGRKHRTMSRLK